MRSFALAFLLLAAPQAHAGIGSLLKAAAKVGSTAGKVGAKSAKLAKGGSMLKGASVLGTGLAAERVFLHSADDVGRVGMFVASEGDGALKVVMRGGDEATHSLDSLKGTLTDLDEMAKVADDAGVDVFLDPSALDQLRHLDVGPNTRLFLANTDGPSWPIRRAADGVAEVGLADRTWVRVFTGVSERSLDLAMKLAVRELQHDEAAVRVVDGDCEGGAADPAAALEGAAPGELIVLVGQEGALSEEEALALAARYGVDLVVLGLAEVCPPGEPAPPEVSEVLERLVTTKTLGELWSVASTEAAPLVVERASDLGTRMVLGGQGLIAVHAVQPEVEEVWVEPAEEDLPEWAQAALGGLVLFGFIGIKVALAARKRET